MNFRRSLQYLARGLHSSLPAALFGEGLGAMLFSVPNRLGDPLGSATLMYVFK
jgi:hypothetical protein